MLQARWGIPTFREILTVTLTLKCELWQPFLCKVPTGNLTLKQVNYCVSPPFRTTSSRLLIVDCRARSEISTLAFLLRACLTLASQLRLNAEPYLNQYRYGCNWLLTNSRLTNWHLLPLTKAITNVIANSIFAGFRLEDWDFFTPAAERALAYNTNRLYNLFCSISNGDHHHV